jgi:acyl-coenzyme A thioesterase PaaI-like protein
MHGGCLMTFADYAIFCIASEHLQESGSVTAQMSCEFIDAAVEGEVVETRGEVIRAGASLIFIRGIVETSGRPLMSYSAILKKVRRK